MWQIQSISTPIRWVGNPLKPNPTETLFALAGTPSTNWAYVISQETPEPESLSCLAGEPETVFGDTFVSTMAEEELAVRAGVPSVNDGSNWTLQTVEESLRTLAGSPATDWEYLFTTQTANDAMAVTAGSPAATDGP